MDDHRQKYVEITKNCLGIEIADERLRFLQTKHLQCRVLMSALSLFSIHFLLPKNAKLKLAQNERRRKSLHYGLMIQGHS